MESIERLVESLEKYNEQYRKGTPGVRDAEYDALVEELRERDPENSFLHTIEPEEFKSRQEVKHPIPMLSIEKAYTKEQVERFIKRVKKEAAEIGINEVEFEIMPKLDGLAGRDGRILATRGNSEVGYDIGFLFEKGLLPIAGRGCGLGEIVIVDSYFKKNLSDKFEHPRNMVAGIAASDNINEYAKVALKDKAVHFVPYTFLEKWRGTSDELIENIDKISNDLAQKTDYPMDGMVAYIANEAVKVYMGVTSTHYRWQIAIKTKGKTGITTVDDIVWQVGRTGNITPVIIVKPLSLSGAKIRRVTAHHAGMIYKANVGIGAEIEVIRSGEVIPKLEKVIKSSSEYKIPKKCPSCGLALEWSGDFLKCVNNNCKARIEQKISHWFKTLGNADWFGIKTIQKIVDNGYDDIKKIYELKETDFINIGFGPVQSKNLVEAIRISRTKPVEDWRFLAAFGIKDLGKGDSRKLLSHIPLKDILNICSGDIEKIDGFGSITSISVSEGIKEAAAMLAYMISLGFNIMDTREIGETKKSDTPISGKKIVFSGKMEHGTREEIQINARKLGAIVQTSISGKTDYLVCGENVGSAKINKSKKLGVEIMTENEYMQIIEKAT